MARNRCVGEASARNDDLVRGLYADYRKPLLSYVLRRVNGDYQAAEDIVQETLLRAWQHAEQLRPEQASGWLYTVAHNLIVSRYRHRRRGPASEVPIQPDNELASTDEELDRALESWQMAAALRALSPAHRAVLIELFYRQQTVAEAAARLGIPAGTVKSRCFYALRALRGALDTQGVTT